MQSIGFNHSRFVNNTAPEYLKILFNPNSMKYDHLRKICTISILLSLSLTTGCAVALIGVGAGIGAFAYHKGKLIRIYESEYHETILASRETLENYSIPIIEEIGDELNTIIKAKRPNGILITIEVEKIEGNLTEVSVRSGAVGVWDKNLSIKVHDLINDKLTKSASKTSIYTTQSIQEKSSPEINYKSDVQTGLEQAYIVIPFDHNSNELSDEAIEKLDQVAKVLNVNHFTKILVSGFSNSTGSRAYNKIISESRAAMVKAYLVGKGIKSSQIIIDAHGAENFLENDETEDGRKLIGRVEIKIL